MRAGWTPWAFLAPALLGLCLFRFTPIAVAIWGSLENVNLLGESRFVGLENYADLTSDPEFWHSLGISILFNLLINPLQVLLALGLALLLAPNDRTSLAFRAVLVLPMAVSTALTAVLFGLFLDRNLGAMNAVLEAVGIGRQPFYRGAGQALFTLIGVATWKGAGYWMLFLLAGLKAVPVDVHEAAAVDGATRLQRFFRITLPLMRRPLAFVLVADTAINFLFFAPVYILTNGGPAGSTRVLMYMAYRAAFIDSEPGRSLAICTLLLGIIALVVAVEMRLLRGTEFRGMIAGERPRLAGRALRFGLLSVAAAAIALPLVWILAASLRPQSQIFGSAARLTWDTFIPWHLVLANYLALPRGDFPRAVGNTAIVAGATVVLGILVNSLAGFALAQFRFRGRGLVLTLVVLSFMMPFEATVIPLYRMMRWFGWLDSYHVLVLPEVANGLVIFLFRQFFAGIPRAFFEAAQVDGASWFRQYRSIAMPLAWPTIATAVLMLFLVQWDAFFWPVVAASSGQYAMVQVTIARNINFEQNDWGGLFASTSLAIALGMLPFLALQRYYIRSLMESGLR